MKLHAGDIMPTFSLSKMDGNIFSSNECRGKKTLITFFRFATCPFCNMRMNQMIHKSIEWKDSLQMIALFESPLATLQKYQSDNKAQFPILADPSRIAYRKFGVTRSFIGMIKGMIMRFPTLIQSMAQGNIPREISMSMLTMPASFLVDEEGVIVSVYYGRDEGDHIPWAHIENFLNKTV